MKTNKSIIAAFLIATSLCSCSDRQMTGTMAGASIGGIFGSSIGGLMHGYRGHQAGTAIGMVVGGVVGNAAGAAIDNKENAPKKQRDNNRNAQRNDTYNTPQPRNLEGLCVENIRFIDSNGNQRLDAGENAKLIFEIHNRGNNTLYNIAPILSCDNAKHISVSPTAIIGNLLPGKGVVYTASIAVSSKVKNGMASFSLDFQDGNDIVNFKTFQIPTARR